MQEHDDDDERREEGGFICSVWIMHKFLPTFGSERTSTRRMKMWPMHMEKKERVSL